MNPGPERTSTNSDWLEIVSTRTFDVPRDALFKAFEDPQQLAEWWGPHGFTNTIHEFDFRCGGVWRFTMHGPNGDQHHNVSHFVDVVKPDKIVFEHLGPVHWFEMTMTYQAAPAGGTVLTWRMVLERSDESEKLKPFMEDANEQNFDRLAEYLKRPKR